MKLLGIFLFFLVVGGQPLQEITIEDKHFWLSVGSVTLDSILNNKRHNGIAKNVILFVGDGMGIPTVTMARIYQGQTKNSDGERNSLTFEKFPWVGLSKTYDASRQVSDSASTATAMFSGVKVKHSVIGLDIIASYNSCTAESNAVAKVTGFMTWAQEKGKDTGIVSTARITHATPAAAYAHVNNRDWECDGSIPHQNVGCVKDIARQLVEDEPGKNFKVILGGGRKQLGTSSDPSDDSCSRTDGKNLVELWQKDKKNAKYVRTAEELKSANLAETDYLLGLFAPGHLNYVGENEPTRPSLKAMTETAIKILSKNPNGFALMVEGARIDMAHHNNYAKLALMEAVEFDEAVSAAVNMTDPEETLIVVTADHSHSAIMNGYPKRGDDILGLAKDTEKSFFETITYSNGPGYEYHHPKNQSALGSCSGECTEVEKQALGILRDIRNEPERERNVHYKHFSGHYLKLSTHGGEDVAVFASGPMAHLLVGVYEQSYIATVISYASCIGPEAYRCKNRATSSSPPPTFKHSSSLALLFAALASAAGLIF